jgi:hypothetical protein
MFHQLLCMPEQGMSFSLFGRDDDSNQLYPARQTQTHTPIRAHISSRGSPFTPFGGESGPFRKTHGPTSSQDMPVQPIVRSKQGLGSVPFLQALLPAMLTVQFSARTRIGFTINYNSGPCYVFGTFNLNQGPIMERSLNDTDGIKEYMPTRHQQQYNNTRSRPVSSYSLSHGSFPR